MKKRLSPERVYLIYSGVSALLFIMMKTVREIYRVDIAHLNSFELVMVGTTLEITHFLFEVPTGIIADKYSRKLSIIIGLFLISCSFFVEGLFPIFFIIIIAQIILGIGDTFTSGADEAWIADEVENKNLAHLFLKATQVGQWFSIIGTLLSILFGFFLIRLPYLIAGFLFIVLNFYLMLYMKETKFKKVQSTDKVFVHMKKSLQSVFQLIKSKSVLKLMFFITLFYGLFSEGFDRLWTPHFLKDYKLPTFDLSFLKHLKPDEIDVLWIGFISLCAMLISIIAVNYIKKHLKKTGKLEKVWLLFYINLLMVFTLFGFAITKHLFITASLFIVFYTVRRINQPVYRAWMNEHIPSNIRATVLSSYGQLDSIGQIIGGPIIGLIALKLSIPIGILSSVVLLLPVVFIYLYFIRKIKYQQIDY